MKNVLLLCCLICSFAASSQITIDLNDMPNAGDSLRYSITTLDSISNRIYREAGENYNWDFSHLEANQQRVANYRRSFQTPYALFFLGFDKYGTQIIDTLGFGQFSLTDIYDFYQRKESAFEAEGRGFRVAGGFPAPAYFTDDDEIYQFPLSYHDRDSSTFSFEVNFQELFTYRSQGYRINNVDAWGTVKTPYGSFECIRVITDVIASDTIAAQGFEFGFRNSRREYKWLAKGEAFPIVEITGLLDENNSGFTPATLRYRDDYRFIESLLAPNADFEASNINPRITQDTVQIRALTQNLPSNNYTWNITPSTFEFVNDSNINSRNLSVVFTEAGAYDVQLKVDNNFGEDEQIREAYIVVGASNIADLKTEYGLQISPNPVSAGQFQLSYHLPINTDMRVDLYDLKGQIIRRFSRKKQNSGQQSQSFSVEGLQAGIYLLNVQISDKRQALPLVILP